MLLHFFLFFLYAHSIIEPICSPRFPSEQRAQGGLFVFTAAYAYSVYKALHLLEHIGYSRLGKLNLQAEKSFTRRTTLVVLGFRNHPNLHRLSL